MVDVDELLGELSRYMDAVLLKFLIEEDPRLALLPTATIIMKRI